MPTADLVLAIDQGTSSSKALLVDAHGRVVASGSGPLSQAHPRPGWVEQSLGDIWSSVQQAVAGCLDGQDARRVAAIGLSTQRESLVVWDRSSGEPLCPLVSWQDQRTAAACAALAEQGHGPLVQQVTGLPLDPMFPATKAQWLLDHLDPDRARSGRGELCLGTVDSWLLSRFGGEHVIEIGNASRTQLFDVHRRCWSPELLELFGVPAEVLPRVVGSTGPFPAVRGLEPVLDGTPVGAVMGDSHAALFAHAGWRLGQVKATYGTGSSVMAVCRPDVELGSVELGSAELGSLELGSLELGSRDVGSLEPGSPEPGNGLCLTIAWDDGTPTYAVEGNIRSSGSTLSWLAETVGSSPAELADIAANASSDGVYLVPAFNGLGAPWWDSRATGLLTGLTLGTRLPQIARAALESIAFQVEDVVAAVHATVAPVDTLLADGGASGNEELMQVQADLSGRRVERAQAGDLSPLGAAHLAGRAVGLWTGADIEQLERPRQTFEPAPDDVSRQHLREGWRQAVARARAQPAEKWS